MTAIALHYDLETAAAVLAALKTCPAEQRMDTLAVVVKAFIQLTDEENSWLTSPHLPSPTTPVSTTSPATRESPTSQTQVGNETAPE